MAPVPPFDHEAAVPIFIDIVRIRMSLGVDEAPEQYVVPECEAAGASSGSEIGEPGTAEGEGPGGRGIGV